MKTYRILLTNDDGIHAEGLRALHEALAPWHDVTVIAPENEKTGAGHGITLNMPLRIEKNMADNGDVQYSVKGTPADCVGLGLNVILPKPPDLVVSGMNAGANVGNYIHYSGTAAAAREAGFYGIPALAVSIDGHTPRHYPDAAVFIRNFVPRIMEMKPVFGSVINMNIPDRPTGETRGIRICRQGVYPLNGCFEKGMDPRGRPYYWQGSRMRVDIRDPKVDTNALADGFITVSPIRCEMTDERMLDELRSWEKG